MVCARYLCLVDVNKKWHYFNVAFIISRKHRNVVNHNHDHLPVFSHCKCTAGSFLSERILKIGQYSDKVTSTKLDG